MSPRSLAAAALGTTLAIQIFVSAAATATAVLAPAIAHAFDVEPRWIGAFVGIVFAGAMTASLASGAFIARFGAIRTSQASALLCAGGLALVAIAPQQAPWLLGLAALVVGIGYGPITPASSQLLARTAPPGRMAVTFSIKQTGVPAGVAVAGALLPSLADLAGWRNALGGLAALGVPVALAAQLVRATLDVERQPTRLGLLSALAPLVHLRLARLRRIALTSLAYSAAQVSLTSFLVVYLTATLAFPLVTAGLLLSAATLGGVAGRIGWGIVADRWLPAARALALIGLLAAALTVGLAFAQRDWGSLGCAVLAAALGATAIGWNGVQLAEVARLAPPGLAGALTAATSFVTFSGVVIGPPLFALVASVTGSYRAAFGVSALVTAGAAAWLLRRDERE